MITLIILIVLIAIGILLINSDTLDGLGAVMCLLFGMALIIHPIVWATASYRYESFVAQRDAFEQTLEDARESGNAYEVMAIVKDVAQWNTDLAARKYDNSTIFLDQYIDDKIESLEPIK